MARPIKLSDFTIHRAIIEVASTFHELTTPQRSWFVDMATSLVLEKMGDLKLVAMFMVRILHHTITCKRSLLFNQRLLRAIINQQSLPLKDLINSSGDITELIIPLTDEVQRHMVIKDFEKERMIMTNTILRAHVNDKFIVCSIEDANYYTKASTDDETWSATALVSKISEMAEIRPVSVRFNKCLDEVITSTVANGDIDGGRLGSPIVLIDVMEESIIISEAPILTRKCYSYDLIVNALAIDQPLNEWDEEVTAALQSRFAADIAIRAWALRHSLI